MEKKDKGKLLNDGKLLTPRFRIDWSHVCTKRPADAKVNAGKYDCVAIWDEETTDFSLLEQVIKEAAKGLGKRFKKPLRSGDDDREGEDGYEGAKFATLSAKKFKPTVIDGNKNVIDDDDQIIDGAYARAVISAWSYNNENQGVAFNLHALQYLGGGARLIKEGSGQNDSIANDAFDELDLGETEEPDIDDDGDDDGDDLDL